MMKGFAIGAAVCCLLSRSAASDLRFSVSMKGTYTTSTRVVYNIDRPFVIEPERIVPSNYGYGADVRVHLLWERFYLGISYESIRATDESFVSPQNAEYIRIPSTEGFEMKMAELSGYYIVPISSDEIQFYMGGGVGIYDGSRQSSLAGVVPTVTGTRSYMGIHVLTGIEYSITKFIGVRGELKFRDPHFDVTDKYSQPFVNYDGYHLRLRQEPSTTRVNLYGINYMLAMVFKF